MSLVVWLPLNGNLNNQGLSNVTVTVTGTTVYTNGKIGQGLSANGSSWWTISPVTLGKTASMAWWLKTTDTSAMLWVLNANVYSSLNFWIYSGKYILNTGDGSSNVFQNNGSNVAALNDGLWHHYVTVFNETEVTLYIDGNYYGKSKTYKSPETPVNSNIKIAGGFLGGHSYDTAGIINDFRVYSHCLSAKEVKEIARGLVVHYKLDEEGSETTVNLASSSSNYNTANEGQTYTASGWGGDAGTVTYYKSGGYNNGPYKIYHKTATGSGGIYKKLEHDIHIISGKTYTMSVYVKASRAYTDSTYSFCINRSAATQYSSGNRYITYSPSVSFTTEWKRISRTFTATDADAGDYGEMSIIYNDSVTDYYVYYSCFQIEENDHPTPYVNGARNVENTTNLIEYSNLGGHGSSWTLQSDTFDGTPIYRNTVTSPNTGNNAGFRISSPITNSALSTATKVTISFYKKLNTVYGKNLGGYLRVIKSDDTEGTYSWSYNKANWANDANSIGIWDFIYSTVTIPTGCKQIKYVYVYTDNAPGGSCDFAKIQLELKDHPTPYVNGTRNNTYDICDYSGYQNGLNIKGTLSISTDSSRYTKSTKFTASSYLVSTKKPNVFLPKDALTVNIWIKCTTWGNPISCTESGGWNFEQSSNKVQFPVYVASVGYKVAASGVAYSTLLNSWHMLTGTFDSDNVKIYIDGELKGTTAVGSTNGISYYNNYLFIAAEAQGNTTTPASSTYAGNISDVRIYSTALSSEDILELYHTAASIDDLSDQFCYELIEDSPNIFTSENLIAEAKSMASGSWGNIVTRNGEQAIKVQAWNFYYAANDDRNWHLQPYFKANKQYLFDMWLDTDDETNTNTGNNYASGLIIKYTDDTSYNFTILGDHENPKGFQHLTYVSTAGKSVKGIYITYNYGKPVYYRLDSTITEYHNPDVSIEKNGELDCASLKERTEREHPSYTKGGVIETREGYEI